jgi:hypothetical protein
MAKWLPMHTPGPPPNGKYASRGSADRQSSSSHGCVFDCFLEGTVDLQQACIQQCQAEHPGFNDGGVYVAFSACVI